MTSLFARKPSANLQRYAPEVRQATTEIVEQLPPGINSPALQDQIAAAIVARSRDGIINAIQSAISYRPGAFSSSTTPSNRPVNPPNSNVYINVKIGDINIKVDQSQHIHWTDNSRHYTDNSQRNYWADNSRHYTDNSRHSWADNSQHHTDNSQRNYWADNSQHHTDNSRQNWADNSQHYADNSRHSWADNSQHHADSSRQYWANNSRALAAEDTSDCSSPRFCGINMWWVILASAIVALLFAQPCGQYAQQQEQLKQQQRSQGL